MKRLKLTALLLMLAAGASVALAQGESLPELVRRIKPSAVAIETFNSRGEKLARGSGFFVSPDRVITNRHVIEGAYRAEIHLANGNVYSVRGVLAVDGEGDIALLQADVPPGLVVPLEVVRTTPQEGESVVVIGNPFGLEGSVSNGIVSAVRDIPNFGRIIQITAPISPGSSGSPVVNMLGQVIGVATLQVSEGQSLNFAIPGDRIAQLRPTQLTTLADTVTGTRRNKRASAERFYMQGLGFLARDDYARALPYFEKAADADPDYAEAWYQTGFCYGMLGRHADSLRASKQVTRLRPEWPATYSNMGASYYALGQFKEAVDAYRQAIRLEPYNADSHYALALAYSKLNQTQDEIQSLRRAVGLRPDHASAYERLALAYFRMKRYGEALGALEQLKVLKPTDAKVYNYLGETYIEMNRASDAVEALNQAINIDPALERARYNLGRAFIKIGDRDSAIAQYNILRTSDSDWADKLYNVINP
ncbi:MAG TPA: tetratricopeptide repeat protein [Pyrinomonadaceae bacterium]|jgi:tetratricopeptide (TPR) repeat protein